jgi:CHAT domain-containing protein
LRLGRTPSGFVESLVGSVNEIARGTSYRSPGMVRERMQAEGNELWRQLIPEPLARRITTNRISSLTIIADADPVPWEIVWPNDGDPRFLVERFPVTRWVRDGAPAARVSLDTPRCVASASDLKFVRPEIDSLSTLLRSAGHDLGTPIMDLPTLIEVLQAGTFGLLHFACHNAYSSAAPASSSMRIGNEPFTPSMLNRHERRFEPLRPTVFMNACRTAGTDVQYTAAAGWAQKFVAAGCGAFVGSLWEVRDDSARAFALSFYEALQKGQPLSGAMATARAAIERNVADPTWLAYSVYGDAGATV